MSAGELNPQRVARVLAYLLRNEHVPAAAIERAVISAVDMTVGQAATLLGDDPQPWQLRRAFVWEQLQLLERAS